MQRLTPALICKLFAFIVSAWALPAIADTPQAPVGAPCLKNNGNPCKGNNGNLGHQGNAGERTRIDRRPPSIGMSMPSVNGRGAYIDQIGSGSKATIVQTAPNAYAKVTQVGGPGNEADISQRGTGTAYAVVSQNGSTQFARAEQSGAGQNALWLTQSGSNNWIWSRQDALTTGPFNGAVLSQAGNNNDMQLTQSGSDNRAALAQSGDGNGMTVTQNGAGNRLNWTQTGNGLSDLQIVQSGGAAQGGQLLITQTNH